MEKKKAYEIELFDVILFRQRPFIVWDRDIFFKDDEVSKKYSDYGEVLPEDSIYTFYHETDITIDGIVETVIDKVPHDKEFYFLGEYKPEYDDEKDTRIIPRILRFKILYRDKFKCVLCGRGATNGISLHIDHIIPHSLAGKTIESNLQTLCEDCNLGKKNRVIV